MHDTPKLTVVVTTTGRRSLALTLDSIKRQELLRGDQVLLVHDGPVSVDTERLWERVNLPGQLIVLNDGPCQDWGHTPRNRVSHLVTEGYVLHFDDDDRYRPEAFAAVRRQTALHPGAFLVFRMRTTSGQVLWQSRTLETDNVGTPMFVYPAGIPIAQWESFYGGDSRFARETVALNPDRHLVFVEDVIADVRPPESLKANARAISTKAEWFDGATREGARGREDCQWGWQNWVGDSFRRRSILDVGAGLGLSRQRLARNGNVVTLHDPGPGLAVDLHGDLSDIANRSFDVVTAFDVIEHVIDDDVFLFHLCRIARESVVITTPNYNVSRAGNPFHVREYTPGEFLELLGGLRIDSLYFGDPPGMERISVNSDVFAKHTYPHQAAVVDTSRSL